ncbi:hypothetical protein TorRG33x02_264510 [Trema orientale]|uniref:Uncharacterized protein n=1 Tax=Trema orientale TaxID=63057 RepID=A0A2P5D290_TREOI|nr:hypothetical protein TorRG33x02_264510 [Trema orientale]
MVDPYREPKPKVRENRLVVKECYRIVLSRPRLAGMVTRLSDSLIFFSKQEFGVRRFLGRFKVKSPIYQKSQ